MTVSYVTPRQSGRQIKELIVSSAQLDIARVIGLERQAEARASAQSATARQARRERRLSHRRARVAARSNG